jgi:signal transduction histidine kinase
MGHQAWQRRVLLFVIGIFALSLIGGTLMNSSRWINHPFPGFFIYENLTVGPYALPHWSGVAGGMRSFDTIVSLNGKPVTQRDEIYAVVRNSAPGSIFRYGVARASDRVEVDVKSMIFATHDWLLSFGLFILVGIAFLVIGVAPYFYNSPSPAAWPLGFMAADVFVWFVTTFDFVTTGALPREVRIFAFTLTLSAGLHLGLLLKTGSPLRVSRPWSLCLIYGISLMLGWLYTVTFFDPEGWWLYVFRASYMYSCLAALMFLWLVRSALRRSLPDVERSRLRVMFFGAVLGFFLPTFCAVLTSSFRWAIPYNLALIPTLFFPFSVAYGLLKYRLFDLGNTLKLGLSRLSLTVFLLLLYAGIVGLLELSVGIYERDPLIPLFFSVLVVSMFNPVLRWTEGVVDRYIYRQEYDPVQAQNEISFFLRSLATAPELAKGFLKRVVQRLQIENAALVYRQTASEYLAISSDEKKLDGSMIVTNIASMWGRESGTGYQGVSRGEVSTSPEFRAQQQRFLDVFERLEAELLIPIVFEQEVRGLVSFGARKGGEEYSADDLRLLNVLTDQLALALENGKRYEESEKAKEAYRKLYDEAEAAKGKLIETDRIKKQFVANICHELRTPVSTILGFGEVLLDPNFRGDSRSILERLVSNGQDLSQVMDNLLDFSQLEAHAPTNRFEPVNLRDILEGLQLMTKRLIRGRPIEFRINLESEIGFIQSDARKIQQILVHLLTNALKFTEKGAIEVGLKTIVDEEGNLLQISVSDTGIGIDKKDLDVIFEEFRQLDGSSTRHYGGTGLGLSLCRNIAKTLGGRITVDSEFGAGSVFSLLLPMMPLQRPVMAEGLGASM